MTTLLSRTHPIGRFGYSSEDWRQLEADLRNQYLPKEAAADEPTPYGRKFVIRATLVEPSGTSGAFTFRPGSPSLAAAAHRER